MKKKLFLGALMAQFFAVPLAMAQDYCREFTQTLNIGNKTEQAFGTACQQADGSWQIQSPARIVAAATPAVTTRYIVRERPVYYRQRHHHFHRPAPIIRIVAPIQRNHGHRHHRGGHGRHYR